MDEFNFTGSSVGKLALALHQAIRQHRINLPDDPDLLDELATVRLEKNTLGVYRLQHDSNSHDDQAVALALGCHHLMEQANAADFHFGAVEVNPAHDPFATGGSGAYGTTDHRGSFHAVGQRPSTRLAR